MSTRCLIGRKVDSNKVEYIYCHHDGYLDGVGETLNNYYTTKDNIVRCNELENEMIEAGDKLIIVK